MNMRKLAYLIFCITFTAAAREPETQANFEPAHKHETVGVHIQTGWESRYSLEGRDSLDGDSLLATSIELDWNRFSGGIWYGQSPNQHYDELRMSLGLNETVDDFEFYASYTHLQFLSSDLHDNEVGMGGSWSGLPLELVIALDTYYSFDADGSFWQVALNRTFEISDRLTVAGSGMFGVNQGYVADGHDGANNLALRIGTEYIITPLLTLTAHATYSWAVDSDSNLAGDEQLVDFFHGGASLQWSF